MQKGTYVYCTTQFEGFHQWVDAPEEVSFLRDMHRHIFHVKVVVRVIHNNRSTEFIMLKRNVDTIIKWSKSKSKWTGQMSCEQIAESIANQLRDTKNAYDVHSVEVSEDGENGAVVVC